MKDLLNEILNWCYDYVNDNLECPFCDGDWFIAQDTLEIFGHNRNCSIPEMERVLDFYDPMDTRHCSYEDVFKFRYSTKRK